MSRKYRRPARDVDDIESQTSSSGEEVQPTEWVGTTLTEAKAATWQAKIGTIPTGPRGHFNPHGLLAAQRYVAERVACEELLKNGSALVVDVGGAPHRTYDHLGDRGRYQMPCVHLGDQTRLGRVPHGARDKVCSHKFEECKCYDGDVRCYLMTHSAYYLEPSVLWEVLNDDHVVDVVVVEHKFNDVFGGFYSEATWSVTRESVTMTVIGNNGAYRHPLPAWHCGWVGEGGRAIVGETLLSLDDVTFVTRLHAVRLGDEPARSLTWGDVETDDYKSGPVQFSASVRNAVADNAKFTQVTFDIHRVEKIGPFLYTRYLFRGDEVGITVPVNGVAMVATHCLNRERNAALYTEVTHMLKNRWARARIPPEILARTMAAVVALGFVVNLHNEVDLMYTAQTRLGWLMNAHAILLSFGKLAVRSWVWFAVGNAVVLLTLLGFDLIDDSGKQIAVATVVVLGSLMLCNLVFWCGTRVHRTWRDYTEEGWVASYGDEEGPRAPLLGNGFAFTRGRPLPGSRYVKPPERDIVGSLSVGTSREKEFENNRMLISGIIADGANVNALHTTQQAELSAVTNRVLRRRRNPEESALADYAQSFRSNVFTRVGAGVSTGVDYLNKWLDKQKDTYPKEYIDMLRENWHQYQGVEVPPGPTKGFLKIEKSAATVKTDEAKATKPRLIQPPEDVDKAITGPIVWQLYEHIRTAWDGFSSPVMYCSGYSCDRIGKAVDNFIATHGEDVVGWSVDMAAYDSTLCYDIQEPAFLWYEKLGSPVWIKKWLTRIRTRGVTPNGVYYKAQRNYEFEQEKDANDFARSWRKRGFSADVKKTPGGYLVVVEDFQMTSGRMDTNLTDTVVLVATVTYELEKCGIPYLLLACGDDGFLMLRSEHAGIVEVIQDFQRRLGLEPEGVVSASRSRWEFCSKLFWFGVDPKTRVTQTVLGSKPFRGVARMGTNTTLKGAANAAQAALSVRVDSGHVPFLGAFADRTYELCKEKRIRPVGKVEWTAIRGSKRFDPSMLNYVLTQERYNLGKENEDEFKLILSRLHSVPIVFQYAPLEDAVKVDET